MLTIWTFLARHTKIIMAIRPDMCYNKLNACTAAMMILRRRHEMSSENADHGFLLSELIKRDFIKKYKRTSLGILWTALSPLLLLITMDLIFGTFFGKNMPHYTIYLFSGLLLFNYFSGTTKGAMGVLNANAAIYSKVPVPKLYFILSHSAANLIDFAVSLLVFFVFVAIDGISFHPRFFMLIYPVLCLYVINLGIGLFLSTLFIFVRDLNYLWPVITRVIMYASAIFYDTSIMSGAVRRLLYCNPLFMCIDYFRRIVIHSTVPSAAYHVALGLMALFCLALGLLTYRVGRDKIALYV